MNLYPEWDKPYLEQENAALKLRLKEANKRKKRLEKIIGYQIPYMDAKIDELTDELRDARQLLAEISLMCVLYDPLPLWRRLHEAEMAGRIDHYAKFTGQ